MAYAPVMLTLKLPVPFPNELLRKKVRPKNESLHASSIVSGSNETTKDALKMWFVQSLANPHGNHFELMKPDPDERQAQPPPDIMSFQDEIGQLNFKLWDIQNQNGENLGIILEDSNLDQRKFSGRADYLISTNRAQILAAASQHCICVIEKQSKPDLEECEYQLVAYMVIMMNQFGFLKLTGIFVRNDGQCRAFRACRDITSQALYEQNDLFPLYQLPGILPELLNF